MKKITALSSSITGLMLSASVAFAADTINLEAPQAAGSFDVEPGTLITFVINGLIIVGIIASLIWLLFGGIKWVISGGDKAKVDSARGTIVASIVGLIIVILAWVIINTVLTVLTGCGLGNFELPTLADSTGASSTRCK